MKTTYLVLLLCLISTGVCAEPLLLTGKVSSAQKQLVTAPKSNRWQIQIQWMEDEGKVVEKGDLIAVFDGSTIQAQLDVNGERAETIALELKQIRMEFTQKLTEAEGALRVAKMQVEKARIEATVPASEVSQYDKGQYELTLQRMLLQLVKAEEKFKLAKEQLRTNVQKHALELLKIEEQMAYQRKQIDKMNVTADFNGPITYAIHPWYGTKLVAGSNIQASWQVLDVQATDNFQIESWLHEIDADKVRIGDKVKLVLDAYPGKIFEGQLSVKSTQSEKKEQWSTSVYFPVMFSFSKMPDEKLLPGMSVRIVVPSNETEVAMNE